MPESRSVRRFMCRLTIVGLVAAAGLALAAASPFGFAAETLQTPTVEIAWSEHDAAPRTWRVLADEANWRSFLSRDIHGDPIGRHLVIDGPGFDEIVWQTDSPAPGTVTIEGTTPDNTLTVRRTFTSAEGDYRVHMAVEVDNLSERTIELGRLDLTLGPGLGERPVEGLGIATRLYSFVEAIGSANGTVERPAPSEAGEASQRLESLAAPDWLGLYSRYFAMLIAPQQSGDIAAVQLSLPRDTVDPDVPDRYLPQLSMTLATDTLAAGETRRWEFVVFAGPRSRTATAGEPSFDEVLFPGLWEWMRYLCFGLLWLLEVLFALIPSWGLAIIVLAVLVRLVMYPLAKRTMAGQQAFTEVQRKIQPEIREIKKRYTGGEQSERILQLYEHHKVSPLAGLKPLLIVLVQIPVFVALFHVLGQAYELREAPFLWIDTLAEPDQLFGFGTELPFFGSHFNLLPVLMAVTTLMTLQLSPAPAADATSQRRQSIFLGLMAVGFFLIFYPFPSGMVLYWTTANILHIIQSKITPAGDS